MTFLKKAPLALFLLAAAIVMAFLLFPREWVFDDMRLANGRVHASEIRLTLKRGGHLLSIGSLSFEKAMLKNVRASFTLKGLGASFDRIRMTFAGQEILGTAEIRVYPQMRWKLSLLADSLPAQTVIDTLEWDKKVAVQGVFTGRLEIEGEGQRLTRFDGLFKAHPEGGNITILDQEMLKRVADSAHQPIEIVKASFENYHYNEGSVQLALEQADLKLDLALNGEAGKRKLEVNLHDLFPRT